MPVVGYILLFTFKKVKGKQITTEKAFENGCNLFYTIA